MAMKRPETEEKENKKGFDKNGKSSSNSKRGEAESTQKKNISGHRGNDRSDRRNNGAVRDFVSRVRNAAACNLSYPVGATVGKLNSVGNALVAEHNIWTVGCIFTLGSDEGANLLAQKIWATMRARIGTTQQYDAGDVLMYEQCAESMGIAITMVKRVVKLADTYKKYNTLFPKHALMALGFTFEEVWDNINDYREEINRMVEILGMVDCPCILPTYPFRCALAGVIYKDDDTEKAQHIMFVPEGFWKWIPNTKPGDAVMEWEAWSSSGNNITTVKNLFRSMEQLLTDSTATTIRGDIMNGFRDNIVHYEVEPIMPGDTADILFDPMMMYRLHNATFHNGIGATKPDISWVIPEAEGQSPYLVQSYHVNSLTSDEDRFIIDVPQMDVPEEFIAEVCRWKSSVDIPVDSGAIVNDAAVAVVDWQWDGARSYPMEILTELNAFEFDQAGVTSITKMPTTFVQNLAGVSPRGYLDVLSLTPIAYGKSSTGAILKVYGDRSCFTIMDTTWLYRLFKVYSEGMLEI